MKLKALAAIAVAGIMVMSVPMVAMADVTTTITDSANVDGNVIVSTGEAINVSNKTVNVTGIAKTTANASAITAVGSTIEVGSAENNSNNYETIFASNGCNITVDGKVENKGTYETIHAVDGATVTAGSATNGVENQTSSQTIYATGTGTTVTVKADEATGATGAVTNNGNGTAIDASSGATVKAESATGNGSNKSGNNKAVVVADGDGTRVAISKNVTNNARKTDESHIGDSAIKAANNASVEVGGDVTNNGATYAIEASSNASVIVTGTVAANGGAGAIRALTGATVVAGNAENNFSSLKAVNLVVFANDSTVVIEGDATNDVKYRALEARGNSKIVVEGTVKSGTDGAVVATYGSSEVIVYKIENTNPEGTLTKELGTASICYIIKGTDSTGISGVTGTTDKTVLDKTYKTAQKDTVITVSVASGYELKTGTIQVVQNADGTYSVTIPEGGGVTLEAIMKAIQSKGGSYTSIPTSQGSASAPLTSGSWAQASNGKFTYTNNGEKLINCTAWIQYTDANGQVVTGKFCFDNSGYMITNAWKEVQSGVWNYFGADGKMVVNATTPDGYDVDANGEWRK